MGYDIEKIKEVLQKALLDMRSSSKDVDEAVFHMTDWLDDLDKWHKFCEDPNSMTMDEVQNVLMGFLVHVPNHVAAASKIITGFPVTDVFGIRATSEKTE